GPAISFVANARSASTFFRGLRAPRRSMRYVRVVAHDPAQRPIRAARDADAWGDLDLGIRHGRPFANRQRAALKVGAIEAAVDSESVAKLRRTVREIDVATSAAASLAHHLDSDDRLERADEHRAGFALRAGHGVETPVHAVDEIHVRDSRALV